MKQDKVKRLDEFNLIWLAKQVSLGNIVRGLHVLGYIFKTVRQCVVSVAEKILKQTEVESKNKD
jgi:hypothetical protein